MRLDKARAQELGEQKGRVSAGIIEIVRRVIGCGEGRRPEWGF